MARATLEDLERRLSADVVRRIYDDANVGSSDSNAVAALLDDASAKVDSYLAPIGLLPLTEPYPREVIRLELDIACAYAAQRFPETLHRINWADLLAQAERDLDRLRMGKTMLGTYPSAPDPAANHGGVVYQNTSDRDASLPDAPAGRWDDMGDF